MKKITFFLSINLLLIAGIFFFAQDAKATLATPHFLSPQPGTTISELTITLDWSDVAGAGAYEVCYQRKEDHWICHTTINTEKRIPEIGRLRSNSEYFWRVRACVDSSLVECSPYSGSWRFNTPSLSSPTRLFPHNRATISTLFLSVRLRWSSVRDAGAYEICYQKAGHSWICHITRYTEKRIPESGRLEPNVSYHWRVRACTDTTLTDCGPYSRTQTFMVTDTPILVSPPSGTIISTPPIILDWRDVEGARVYEVCFRRSRDTWKCLPAWVSERSLPIPFEGGQSFEWKVRACRGWRSIDQTFTECGPESGIWNFSTARPLQGLITINTATASKYRWSELMGRRAICENVYCWSLRSLCWQIYESSFDSAGRRMFGWHLTLNASFLLSAGYSFYFTDAKTGEPWSLTQLPVGKILKLNIEKPQGEWIFAGGVFDCPPITWVDDAQANYEAMVPITPLYEYSVSARQFNPAAFNILRPKMGVAATDPIKTGAVSVVSDDPERIRVFREGVDYYIEAKASGIARIRVTIRPVFAYVTIDNLWFERGSIPGREANFDFSVVSANQPPIANAGLDKEVLEGQTIILEGSGSDPDGDLITFSWSCTGGTLSDSNVAQPTFRAPLVDRDTIYSCTLRVTDERGDFASSSINILVKDIPNTSPSAINLSVDRPNSADYCGIVGSPPVRVRWEFRDPDAGDRQSAFQIQVATTPDFAPNSIINNASTEKITGPSQSHVIRLGLTWGQTYYWRVRVWDDRNGQSDWASSSFTTIRFPFPFVNFNWQPSEPIIGENVQFCSVYDVAGNCTSTPPGGWSRCYSGSCEWLWEFFHEGEARAHATSTLENPFHAFTLSGRKRVKLTITDTHTPGERYSCWLEKTITIRRVPIWYPAPP